MSSNYKFVYPIYAAQHNILPGYTELAPKVRTQNLVPSGAVGHIYDKAYGAFLCDESLTRHEIAKQYGCKKTSMRDTALPSRSLCPECQAAYLKMRGREPARYRAWKDKKPLTVRSGCFE